MWWYVWKRRGMRRIYPLCRDANAWTRAFSGRFWSGYNGREYCSFTWSELKMLGEFYRKDYIVLREKLVLRVIHCLYTFFAKWNVIYVFQITRGKLQGWFISNQLFSISWRGVCIVSILGEKIFEVSPKNFRRGNFIRVHESRFSDASVYDRIEYSEIIIILKYYCCSSIRREKICT